MKKLLLFILMFTGCIASAQTLPTKLLQPVDLKYEGVFRVPKGSVTRPPTNDIADSLSYGGTALTYNPYANTLLIVSHTYGQKVAEINIPVVTNVTTTWKADREIALAALQTASIVNPAIDPFNGKRTSVATPTANILIGGMFVSNNELFLSAFDYYDGTGAQKLSHFRRTLPLSDATAKLTGPFQLAIPTPPMTVGMWSGYMAAIPAEWQNALGGNTLIGNCCLSIISRTSYGPAAFAYTIGDVGAGKTAPKPLVYYDQRHQTLGTYGTTNPNFNGTTQIRGAVFVKNTATVLFFGRHGAGEYCYGTGTSSQTLHHKPVGTNPADWYCYDPINDSKGEHGYPYVSQVWAYNANDFVAVKNGTKQAWNVLPYAVFPLPLPFEGGMRDIVGAAYDPTSNRIYVSQGNTDTVGGTSYPLIHVLSIGSGSITPPIVPTPPIIVPDVTSTDFILTITCTNSNGTITCKPVTVQ